VIAIGASAGGLHALRAVLPALPADFAAPLCIVMHTAPDSPGLLHEILGRVSPLPVAMPKTRTRLAVGHVYVAPPDRHLLVEPGRVIVSRGPRENRFRPAIDPLFRTAAQVYGPRAIGVVLTGNLDDGAAGLFAIKQLGGLAVVQDPVEAEHPSMPRSALTYVAVDHVVRLHELAPLLVSLIATPPAEARPAAAARPPAEAMVPAGDALNVEVAVARQEGSTAMAQTLGPPSPLACPECHGVLLEVKDSPLLRFRCHTGHAYTAASLAVDIDDAVERSLWNAVRALEEASMLKRRLGTHLGRHDPPAAEPLLAEAARDEAEATSIRRLIAGRPSTGTGQHET